MNTTESTVEQKVLRRGPSRRSAIWVVLALVAGVLAVTAGLAGAGDGAPSVLGVQPAEVALGGQPNDCSAVSSAAPTANELRIENPQDGGIYTGPGGVTVTLVVSSDDKLLDFVLSEGWVVFDVIVKGGQKSAHFDYEASTAPGPVPADQSLHAPTKGNGQNLFSISHVSFCYQEAFAASGTVYVDANQDGVRDAGEGPDAPRVITAYGPSIVSTTSSATDGSYTLFLSTGSSYTICEEAIADFVQTAPDNNACLGLGTSEDGGHAPISTETTGLDFGNAPEICGQFLTEDGVVLDGSFELFNVGNSESPCDNKAGQLFESVEEGTNQLNLPLVGSGSVAGIGVITKTFASPDAFEPLRYAQTPTDGFEVLPWCALRVKSGTDGNQFDPYLVDTSMYPSLVGITDPVSGDPSVSCKVAENENAEGLQTTVVLIQDDPFWR